MKELLHTILLLLLQVYAIGQQLEVDGNVKINGRVTDVINPINPQDVATKNYVDQFAEMQLDAGLNGIVEDFDGNIYKTIKIGTQVWMASNLRTTHYNDGTPIPSVPDSMTWANLQTPGYCWYNNDQSMYSPLYGALYNFYAVADTNSKNVCPVGWDVPEDTDWTVLSDFLGNSGYGFNGIPANIGKSLATSYGWGLDTEPGVVGNDIGSNNSSGFSGPAAGERSEDALFSSVGFFGGWWSSTQDGANVTSGTVRFLDETIDYFDSDGFDKKYGLSVRCVRD